MLGFIIFVAILVGLVAACCWAGRSSQNQWPFGQHTASTDYHWYDYMREAKRIARRRRGWRQRK